MTEYMEIRKRVRSDDISFLPQSKYFINEQIVNSRNSRKMQEVYDKTVSLLFKASNNIELNEKNNDEYFAKQNLMNGIRLTGNGSLNYINKKTPVVLPSSSNKSKCCDKVVFLINFNCKNCNLDVCEFCAFSCFNCNEFVCRSCIELFDCGSYDFPTCLPCKSFL